MSEGTEGSAILRSVTGRGREGGAIAIVGEAALFTAVGLALMIGAGLPEAGAFSVFLAAAALAGRLGRVLDENRDAIWRRGERPAVANRRAVVALAALFVGIGLAFVIVAAVIGPDALPRTFGQTLAGDAGVGALQSRRFSAGVGPLLLHNLGTLAVLMLIGFIYRTYGVLLTLGWNAALWAVVLTGLVARGLAQTSVSGPLFVLGALAAIGPHLLIELLGYVLGTLAAVFASRGLLRHPRGDKRRRQVAWAVTQLFAVGVALLMLAALVEHYWAPWMLARLR
ncbi:MAG: stage II sporulation protein M [Myxococcales bacterium]|nr:stage II sporulation protein M [Myxococcales bacterium]